MSAIVISREADVREGGGQMSQILCGKVLRRAENDV